MQNHVTLRVGTQQLRFHYEPNDSALFLALGAAVAEVQALEFHLVHMMGMLLETTDTSHNEVTEEYFRRTLGTLAKKMRASATDAALAETLDETVRKRNYLIHGFLRAHQWPMTSDTMYLVAIRELDEMTKFFRASGDAITMSLKRTKDLQVFLAKSNPETDLPEWV
jgi:hypothetical protein